MNARRGFTIVEIVIVMVIMAILIGLAVLNISSTQANARDNKRKTDVENIARGLETRYKEGNPVVTAVSAYPDVNSYIGPGTYPSVAELFHTFGQSQAGWTPQQVPGGYGPKNLSGTSEQSFTPPAFTEPYVGVGVICSSAPCTGQPEAQSTINSAFSTGNNREKYLYEPIDTSGQHCLNTPCVRFNLYYWSEIDNEYKMIKSKHQ